MLKVFKDSSNEALLKIYFQTYLLIERSLRIRSHHQLTIREMMMVNLIERLAETNRNTPSALAEYLQVSLPIISTSVKSLIRKGYITKKMNHDDNRVSFLQVTQKGKQSNMNSLNLSENLIEKSFKQLNPFELKGLQKLLKMLEKVIDEENKTLDAIEETTTANHNK